MKQDPEKPLKTGSSIDWQRPWPLKHWFGSFNRISPARPEAWGSWTLLSGYNARVRVALGVVAQHRVCIRDAHHRGGLANIGDRCNLTIEISNSGCK